MINKRRQGGFVVRTVASVIIVTSLPFLIVNPTNIIAQIIFGFGNFLMLLGGLLE